MALDLAGGPRRREGQAVSGAGCGEGEHEVSAGGREHRALFQEIWQEKEVEPEERRSRGR